MPKVLSIIRGILCAWAIWATANYVDDIRVRGLPSVSIKISLRSLVWLVRNFRLTWITKVVVASWYRQCNVPASCMFHHKLYWRLRDMAAGTMDVLKRICDGRFSGKQQQTATPPSSAAMPFFGRHLVLGWKVFRRCFLDLVRRLRSCMNWIMKTRSCLIDRDGSCVCSWVCLFLSYMGWSVSMRFLMSIVAMILYITVILVLKRILSKA